MYGDPSTPKTPSTILCASGPGCVCDETSVPLISVAWRSSNTNCESPVSELTLTAMYSLSQAAPWRPQISSPAYLQPRLMSPEYTGCIGSMLRAVAAVGQT